MSLELKIAGRYLRAKKREGVISVVAALSIIGIALGVATLIIVLSVMNGFRTELMGRIIGINSHVSLYGMERGIENYPALAAEIKKDKRIVSVTPLIEGHAVLFNPQYKDAVDGVQVRGILKADLLANSQVINKDFKGEIDEESIVIGSKLAQNLGVSVGDYVSIITPNSVSTVFGSIPRKKTFRVSGLFEIGMHEYDRYLVFMPFATAQEMFSFEGRAESLGIRLHKAEGALPYALELSKKLPALRVVDWQQANAQFFGAVSTERNVMFIILSMIVLVASFNIIGSMIMLVQEKSGSIAIMRTMGMARGRVMRVFIMVGSFNGIVGTLVGIGLGLLFCLNIENIQYFVEWVVGGQVFSPEIYFLSNLPAEVKWQEVAQVAVISLGISLLATIYPSWKASKIDPAEVLRYE
jgi:lipoprotein-releasing system permease protein